MPETALGAQLNRQGQHNSIVTIAASGPRFIKGNMFPTQNTVKVGDTISLTVGYSGGSSSRAAYAVHDASELPQGAQDYVEKVAAPYFAAYTRWLEEIHVGMTGGEMFDKVEEILPVQPTAGRSALAIWWPRKNGSALRSMSTPQRFCAAA